MLCEKGLNSLPHNPSFINPEKESIEKIVGKEENAGNQHFLLFPQCFPPVQKGISVFNLHLFCRLQMF